MPRTSWDQMASFPVPSPPPYEQRRIADFLDDRVARIDQIITAKERRIARLGEWLERIAYEAVSGAGEASRRPSSLSWLPSVPRAWPVLTVGTEFQVDLGKMLNESLQSGVHSIFYLRNTNVQWDRIDTIDLKEMDIAPDERQRYTLRAGDLLICEGGQPGRAAIWDGALALVGFQKALHRARSRGRSYPGWLLECLRVAAALNVFAVENGQTTIAHLTNEQLRSTRFPFPPPEIQTSKLTRLAERRKTVGALIGADRRAADILQEYKLSLITAAVMGEFDVTTASTKIPGE